LLTLADVDRKYLVLQAGFLEENRDLMAVRRGPVMYVNHDKPFASPWADAPDAIARF
jgi:hypothetical protein